MYSSKLAQDLAPPAVVCIGVNPQAEAQACHLVGLEPWLELY